MSDNNDWDRDLARMIDHTLLSDNASEEDVRAACEVARHYGFATVVAAPEFLKTMVRSLGGSAVRVCTVVSFPDGNDTAENKAEAAKRLIRRGADEIDVVMNVDAFLEGRTEVVADEVRRIAGVCGARALFKLIIETSRLTPEQIAEATRLAVDGGADFVKTSTGRNGRGATVDDVRIIREAAGDRVNIKASGGIRDAGAARELIAAGADRLGTSASLEILGVKV